MPFFSFSWYQQAFVVLAFLPIALVQAQSVNVPVNINSPMNINALMTTNAPNTATTFRISAVQKSDTDNRDYR